MPNTEHNGHMTETERLRRFLHDLIDLVVNTLIHLDELVEERHGDGEP